MTKAILILLSIHIFLMIPMYLSIWASIKDIWEDLTGKDEYEGIG